MRVQDPVGWLESCSPHGEGVNIGRDATSARVRFAEQAGRL